MSEIKVYPIEEILKLLPHRYPFLLLDRLEVEIAGQKGVGIKNVTMNEEFFQGHFPDNPVMPGVLQIEAMAQCSAPILYTLDQYKDKLTLFAGVDNVRFKGIVRPGDRLDMEVELTKMKGPICKSHGKGYVDGKLVVEADMTVCMT